MITNLKIDEGASGCTISRVLDGRDALRRLEPAGPGLRRPQYVVDDRGNRYTYAYVDDAAARWLPG
ncbi:MAG: hypothetical protein ACLSVD_13190 [Eggerthellaceae bacterium]